MTGSSQQEAWTRGALPDVERVAQGIWSVPVPMPKHPMRYVLCYVLESRAGPVLVDPGWPDDLSWMSLADGLARAGWAVSDVHGVLVTHAHSDHHGLAHRVREQSGCWVGMHRLDAALLRSMLDGSAAAERNGRFLDDCGVPAEQRPTLFFDGRLMQRVGDPSPDRLIDDGDDSMVPGRRVLARWTPGHTPGHMCFLDVDEGMLLTGDHLLPRISSHIGTYDSAGPDVLGDYLISLRGLAERKETRDVEVLPAHEYRFRGVRARVRDLLRHHEQRLNEVLEAVRRLEDGTTWQVAARINWSRTWEETTGARRRLALAETLSHLVRLKGEGLVLGVGGPPIIWRAINGKRA